MSKRKLCDEIICVFSLSMRGGEEWDRKFYYVNKKELSRALWVLGIKLEQNRSFICMKREEHIKIQDFIRDYKLMNKCLL